MHCQGKQHVHVLKVSKNEKNIQEKEEASKVETCLPIPELW